MGFGPTEMIIILVLIILLFGVGRISRVGGELGSAIHEFRKGLNRAEDKERAEKLSNKT